ncbi:MAG: thiamine phosphate synthase [Nitrospirae bacterium CG_4_10_14_3_um_filter_44_29]|nr:MAG: thiamine phosphate synthase [Nitrospirae bacterium CG22_combo_CG10-13_8_21_14_all_44_11]PIV40170.1 MAG: thiamine phosphate synthase [Nitrospirae bacterium CG02_land_8_20_14_3_00_44_33]PIV65789.1 MAG: thiamine phosphate synthase [Nitrospirae bacterium CG01_land_8_20_14_3_00_44_22]PIX88255.1 MAG: thiamine phosphate synthase [Nitrospirae bacterium CG_4_10_14_3_um_filter_44_29]PJA82308.1 MAG: thiamine phosphate synthase [Nitrospirae bacterium CG_4_9_14_3_um_filter_44_28]
MYLNGLCFITARKESSLTLKEIVAIILSSGVRCIQYREKDKSRRDLYREALLLRKLTTEFGAIFIVNDYADIALAVNADGVHLGQSDLPLKEAREILGNKKIIGISTHSIEEAIAAGAGGADYIGFGPIFHTATKDAGKPKGIAALREIKKIIKIPVVAIGGIKAENLESVIDSGADAVAVSSAIIQGDISGNVTSLLGILENGRHK